MKVPSLSSAQAWRSSSRVFITMGPYHATGSSMGLPDTSRNRMPSSPACTTISSPWSNSTSDRLPAGPPSCRPVSSFITDRGCDASRKVPLPANTYANAWWDRSIGIRFRRPGGTKMST